MPHAVDLNHRTPDLQVADGAWLDEILLVVKRRKGLDFREYRRPTLLRRARNRMLAANIASPAAYYARLVADPGEADALVERLTIKVSKFFRDAHTFDALRGALTNLAARHTAGPPRVWSAGCARGEEAYSLAIMLAELGQDSARAAVAATDVDAAALSEAALGRFSASALAGVDGALRLRYFYRENSGADTGYRVRPELRGSVSFALHDLTGGAPGPGRFDLVCCRNVLIYMQPRLQERVLMLLARSLNRGGLLCLGEAEWLLPAVAPSFEVVDRKARLFRKESDL